MPDYGKQYPTKAGPAPDPVTESSQRFSIVDLLSLVAAFSIAFAMFLFHRRQWERFGEDLNAVNALTFSWFGIGMTLIVLTLYLGCMVLRRRPRHEVLAASPGRMAVLAICFVSLLAMFTNWGSFFSSVFSLPATLLYLPFTVHSSPLVAASAGLTAWITVYVVTDTRPPTDWLDRSGKICTLLWLLLSFVQPVLGFEVMKAIGIPIE